MNRAAVFREQVGCLALFSVSVSSANTSAIGRVKHASLATILEGFQFQHIGDRTLSNAHDNTVPIAEGLFTWPSNDPCLLGSQCQECGVVTFPVQSGCPACSSTSVESMELEREGTLWTWTIQGFYPQRPPYDGPETPEDFKPFGVGYIELPNQMRVEARIKTQDVSKLSIGMPMKLVVEKYIEREGKRVMSYFFQPAEEL